MVRRTGYQTGGITETRQLPPEYIEALGKTYAADLTRQAGIPSITTATAQQPGETAAQWQQRQAQAQQYGITKAGMADLAPQVATQNVLAQQAAQLQATQAGLGTLTFDPTTGAATAAAPGTGVAAYEPYLTAAGTAATAATGLTGPMTAAQTTAYMSPYQTDVIQKTLDEYDVQAAKQKLALGAPQVAGVFGGGRHGIAEAEYTSASDRNRAAIQSGLLQQGFQQAQQARQQDLANQMGLSNLQTGLGARATEFGRADIAGLGAIGSAQQAQTQAGLEAQRQTAQMAVQDPVQRLNLLGQGVTGLMGGMGQYGTEIGQAPASQSSPLGTALGIGLMGADIYGRIFGRKS